MAEEIITTEVICHVYDSEFIDHNLEDGNIGSGLNLWCLDRDSNPIHLIVKDAPIYCYIELPKYLYGSPYEWDSDSVDLLFTNFRKVHRRNAPFMVELTDRQKLYYYKGPVENKKSKDQMIRAFFNSKKQMAIFCKMIEKLHEYPDYSTLSFQHYEDKISIRRKVFTIRNTRFSQWFKVQGLPIPFESEDRIAVKGVEGRRVQEYIVENYSSIEPIAPEDSMGWITHPRLLSFDIETYTDNHYALPDKYNPNHIVYMISCLYQETGRPNTRKRYVILLGNCNPIEGTEVIMVKTEEEVILQFLKLIESLDPEILMGYNIFGYDYPYIIARQAPLMEPWYPCSRILGQELPIPYENEWASSGYGKNIISYLNMPGRISIDLLPMIRRDYKFDKYTLDFVSKSLLGVGKHDVSPIEMFKAYESKDVEEMTRVTRYCVQDAELVIDLYEKMNIWIGLVEMSNIVGVELMELFTRGQQVRCVSQIYNLTAHRGIILNSRDVPKVPYEGGFVGDPIVGIHDNVICLDFASLYPSIMMAYNICYTTLISPALAKFVSDDDCHIIQIDDKTSYRFVKKSVQSGILPELVENLVNERRAVKAQIKNIHKKLGTDPDTGAIIDQALWDSHPEEYRDIQQLTLKVLDKRQNGLKISANSMYGFLGVQEGGKLPLIEGAMSITARGRQLIQQVNKYLEDKYEATVVYNDTDSSMVSIPSVQSTKECFQKGLDLAVEISGSKDKPGLFPPPLKMEFEKGMRILCIAKKMYAAFLIDDKGDFVIDPKTGKEKILNRGIAIARRDKFGYLKKAYTALLRIILQLAPIEEAFNLIIKAVSEVLSGELPIRGNFTVIRGIGSDYKSPGFFMKVFADELARMGHPMQPGDRAEYVIVKSSEDNIPLGRRMRLIEMFEESQIYDESVSGPRPETMYPKEEIDLEYYLTHGLQNPLDQLFSIGYADVFSDTNLAKSGYEPKSRMKFASVKKPIAMIAKIVLDNQRRNVPNDETLRFIQEDLPAWFRKELENIQVNDSGSHDDFKEDLEESTENIFFDSDEESDS